MSYAQHLPQPFNSPYKGPGDDDPLAYELERAEWRAKQTDLDIRGLAYEWRIGNIDDCTEDAWIEYQVRFGEGASGPQQEFVLKARRRAVRRDSKGRRKRA